MAAKKTTRVSPSKRSEGSTNIKGIVAMKKKTAKVQESGVGNLPATVARGLVAVGKKIKGQQAPKAKPTIAKGQIKKTAPKSNVKVVSQKETHNAAIRDKIKKQMDIIKSSPSEATRKSAAQKAREFKSQLKK